LDVKFNEDETRIIASRFLIQAINISDTNHEKQMVRDLRDICKNAPLNVTIFHPYFVFFDQFELVRPTSIQCMVIGAIIMMIISFIFIPNVLCSIWITFSIISIEVGVVGYMSLWDVNLDSISMINLIMCIGFSIDFTAHICYVYMSSKCRTPEERVREALYSLGLPIVQGGVSTILGVVALLLAESYIFLVFFKMVFLVIFFGAMHGLFLLPVMLSLFGPNSCSKIDDTHLDDAVMFQYKNDKKDPKLLHPFTITHPHLMTLASSPNGIYTSKQFITANYAKGYDEKDLGIGTSSEDSSENSSSKSQRRQQIEDETVKRRYEEGWRKSSQSVSTPSPCTFQPNLDIIYGNKLDDFWNSSDNLAAKPVHYRSRNELFRERSDNELSKNDSLRKSEEPIYARRMRVSHDFESSNGSAGGAGQPSEKKLHYYDYNQQRKYSDESYKTKDKNKQHMNGRRNIV
jgi:hypothetical protein